MLGFTHAVKSNEAYQEVSLEQLSKIDPDILFISANEGKTIVDEWKTNPLWKNLKAVKTDKSMMQTVTLGQDSEGSSLVKQAPKTSSKSV